ncbi:hypothetical protein D3C71_1967470 [compost metagenome]
MVVTESNASLLEDVQSRTLYIERGHVGMALPAAHSCAGDAVPATEFERMDSKSVGVASETTK